MENIAHSMAYETQYNYELGESVDSVLVTEEAKKMFNDESGQILGVLLNSVLMPQALRRGSKLKVMFVFKVLHEFFLASYLVRENLSAKSFPETVKSFCSEIRKGRLAEGS